MKQRDAHLEAGSFTFGTCETDAALVHQDDLLRDRETQACAAGLAAMDIYYSDEFQELLKNNIELVAKRGAQLKENHPNTISFVRQLGMSMGLGVVGPDGQPDLDGTFKILFNSYQNGLLIISVAGNVLRVQPPLNIEPELINRAFDILEASVTDYENGAIGDDVLRYKAGS